MRRVLLVVMAILNDLAFLNRMSGGPWIRWKRSIESAVKEERRLHFQAYPLL